MSSARIVHNLFFALCSPKFIRPEVISLESHLLVSESVFTREAQVLTLAGTERNLSWLDLSLLPMGLPDVFPPRRTDASNDLE